MLATFTMTDAQKMALKWLRERNGTGVFDKNGVLLAGGELAPHTRATWNALRDAEMVEIDGRRVNITFKGGFVRVEDR